MYKGEKMKEAIYNWLEQLACFTGLILVLLLASPVLQLFQTDVDRWMNDPEENYREWTEKMENIQEEFTGTGIREDPMREGIAEVEEIKIGR